MVWRVFCSQIFLFFHRSRVGSDVLLPFSSLSAKGWNRPVTHLYFFPLRYAPASRGRIFRSVECGVSESGSCSSTRSIMPAQYSLPLPSSPVLRRRLKPHLLRLPSGGGDPPVAALINRSRWDVKNYSKRIQFETGPGELIESHSKFSLVWTWFVSSFLGTRLRKGECGWWPDDRAGGASSSPGPNPRQRHTNRKKWDIFLAFILHLNETVNNKERL